LLQDTPVNPTEIDDHLISVVKSHTRKPPPEPDKNAIRSMAYSAITGQESFLKSLVTSLFNAEKRNAKVEELFELLYAQAMVAYKGEMTEYELRIQQEIQDNYKRLLSGKYMPKELTSFFARRDIFSSRWSSPIRSAYKDALDSREKIYLKYMRAYNQCLLAGTEKVTRLTEEAIQQLRHSIRDQDGNKCRMCSKAGRRVELHVHHIIPLDKYGSNHPNNLVTLCHSCHNRQHEGFQVSRNLPISRQRTGGEFVAVDIETTGLSPTHDHIIEVAAVKFNAATVVDDYATLVNPRIPIPHEIKSITGIDDKMLATAPGIDEILPVFLNFVGQSKIVCHNSPFDMGFLRRYAQQFGYSINNEIVDTLPLSRKKLPHLSDHKLQTLVYHFNIRTNGKHRALADSYATGQVYIGCLRL
jgi:DNA polymerase III epsilon subunit family exonuclease